MNITRCKDFILLHGLIPIVIAAIGWIVLLTLLIHISSCSASLKHEKPRDITCSAKCTDCANVELQCHGVSKSEDDENISVTGN
jgi:hypothetical protein